MPEDWRSAMTISLCKGKEERTECQNYRGISLLSVIGKIYTGIFVDRVCRVARDLIKDKQEGFRAGRGCVDQIFTLKQIGEKVSEKNADCKWGFKYL